MIEISKELNYILQAAQSRAKHLGHEYLTLEHIFHSLLDSQTIKKAIEDAFKVEVKSVNTLNTKSKKRRVGKYQGRTKTYKKAMVTLKDGSSIEL